MVQAFEGSRDGQSMVRAKPPVTGRSRGRVGSSLGLAIPEQRDDFLVSRELEYRALPTLRAGVAALQRWRIAEKISSCANKPVDLPEGLRKALRMPWPTMIAPCGGWVLCGTSRCQTLEVPQLNQAVNG